MLLSLHEVALVALAIFVCQFAFSFEQVLTEGTFIGSFGLSEVVDALSLEDAVDKVTLVEAPIGPFVAPAPIFLSLVVLALEADLSLFPGFGAHAVLMVVHPVALVGRALRVDERSAAVGHAVAPLALVHAPVRLDHAPKALHLTLTELSLILRSISPDQDAETILDLLSLDVAPLTLIFLRLLITVNCIDEIAVNYALRSVVIDLVHLRVAKQRWPAFNSLLRGLPKVRDLEEIFSFELLQLAFCSPLTNETLDLFDVLLLEGRHRAARSH